MNNNFTKYFVGILLFLQANYLFAIEGIKLAPGQRQLDSLNQVLKNAKREYKPELYYALGVLYYEDDEIGDLEKTKFYIRKLESDNYSGTKKYAASLAMILKALVLADEEKLDEAILLYTKALNTLNEIPNKDFEKRVKIARIYFYLSDAYERKSNVSKAIECVSKTIRLCEKMSEENKIPFMANMKKHGIDPGNELTIKEAREYLKKFPKDVEGRRIGNNGAQIYKYLRGSYRHIGILFQEANDLKSALVYMKKGQKIAYDMGSNMGYMRITVSIAEVFEDMGQLDSCIENYKHALAIAKQENYLPFMGMISDNLGAVYGKKGELGKALACYGYIDTLLAPLSDGSYKSIESYKQLEGMADDMGIFYVSQRAIINANMGAICMKSDSLRKRGIAYYESAVKAFEQTVIPAHKKNKNDEQLNYAYSKIGEYLVRIGQYKKAIEYLRKSLDYFLVRKNKNEVLLCYDLLSQAYENNNEFKSANYYFKQYVALKDSLFSQENSIQLANFQKRLEVEKKDNQIDLLNKGKKAQKAEIERQKFVRNATMIGLCMVLVLTLVILRSLYSNKKKNKLITQQKLLVEDQKKHIEEKSKEITDSINYARRIQQAILPSADILTDIIPGNFIFYRPKDVVSGDFYQFFPLGDEIIIVTADCTGHGVPGAFMSMIGNEQLSKIIIEKEITKPAEILDALHLGIRKALKQDRLEGETRDGMDIALYKINTKSLYIEYAGANRPLWIVENGTLTEIKANKQPIGGLQTDSRTPFTNHRLKLNKGSLIYTFTDGYADQFGGEKGKKFMLKNLERLLLKIENATIAEQAVILSNEFQQWKGTHEQIDDVLVIGIQV